MKRNWILGAVRSDAEFSSNDQQNGRSRDHGSRPNSRWKKLRFVSRKLHRFDRQRKFRQRFDRRKVSNFSFSTRRTKTFRLFFPAAVRWKSRTSNKSKNSDRVAVRPMALWFVKQRCGIRVFSVANRRCRSIKWRDDFSKSEVFSFRRKIFLRISFSAIFSEFAVRQLFAESKIRFAANVRRRSDLRENRFDEQRRRDLVRSFFSLPRPSVNKITVNKYSISFIYWDLRKKRRARPRKVLNNS